MSEQINQNQHILTEQEMQARDDAIFDTVAEFRNDIDNPQLPEVEEYKGIGEDDAANQVDVNAIFDNRKSEIAEVGKGRHRKAYDEQLDKQRFSEEMEKKRELLSAGVQIKPIEGFGRHRDKQDAFELTLAAKHTGPKPAGKGGKKAAKKTAEAVPYNPAELTEDGEINEDALAAAEKAVRGMARIDQAGIPLGTTEASAAPEPAPVTPPAPRRTPRVMSDGHIGAGHTSSVRVVGGGSAPAAAPTTGEAKKPANLGATGEVTLVTPEARLRERVAAKIGKMVNAEQIRAELGAARDEVKEAWAQLVQQRADRRNARALAKGSRESIWARHGDKITVAAAGVGLVAVAAGLGIQHEASNNEAPVAAASSASPHASESAKPFGPQAPKSSESPSPSASSSASESVAPTHKATPKPSATTKAPTVGPSAIPTTPDFSNKPHVEDPQGPSTERQQTKETDHDSISFTTKDGKVVRATAKLKAGGSIFEAGHDAGLTDTEVANAVNKAGISSQRAEQLPVGQQINFDQQADGSYVVHLR